MTWRSVVIVNPASPRCGTGRIVQVWRDREQDFFAEWFPTKLAPCRPNPPFASVAAERGAYDMGCIT